MPLRRSKQTQDFGACLDTFTAKRQLVTSMSQPISHFIEGQAWSLEPSDVFTTILWSKWEGFCKPQTNKLRARYNLFKSFSQAG